MIDPVWKDLFELLSYVATVVGIPIAIILLYVEKARERRDRMQKIYETPGALYIDYLRLCLDHPELDIFDHPSPSQPSPENKKKEWIAFTILISLMETAYLLYRDHPQRNNSQWLGWEQYIQWWMSRQNFRTPWQKLSPQFDSEFIAYVNGLALVEYPPEAYSNYFSTEDPIASHLGKPGQ